MADRWFPFAIAKCSGSSKNRPANAKISLLIFLPLCLKPFRLRLQQQCLWIFQLGGRWHYTIPREAGRGIWFGTIKLRVFRPGSRKPTARQSLSRDSRSIRSWPRRVPRGCWTASRQIVVWKGQINRQMQRMDSKKGMRSRVTFEDRKP